MLDFADDKLRHAVLFFASKERCMTLTKLMKLLYFLDFRHYEQTGFAVTGQQYEAWEHGPVPRKVWAELRAKTEDYGLSGVVSLIPFEGGNGTGYKVAPVRGAVFDEEYFSRRELRIMNQVEEMFRGVNSGDISMASHEPLGPWAKTWRKCKGIRGADECVIDYDLALTKVSAEKKEQIAELQEDDREARCILETA